MSRVINETKATVVAEEVRLADGIWSRFWGLMGRKALPEGVAFLLRPSSSIHTAFMRFPIDVVFLDRSLRVLEPDLLVKGGDWPVDQVVGSSRDFSSSTRAA